jgi:predicted nucleic acid-binding protein
VPAGRPPNRRNVDSFEDDTYLPEVVVDTSVVGHAFFSKQVHHAACRDFLLKLSSEGTVVFFSELLLPELYEASYKIALKERFGKKDWARRRADGRARRRAARLANQAAESWKEVRSALTWSMLPITEALDDAPALMKHGLGSYDAIHVATAQVLGVWTIATADHGFAMVPPIDNRLLVPPASLRTFRVARAKSE